MTDAEILAAIDVRLGKIPGTRSPEMHRLLASMLAVQRHMERRLAAVEGRPPEAIEAIVAEPHPVAVSAGKSARAPVKVRRGMSNLTAARVQRSREFP